MTAAARGQLPFENLLGAKRREGYCAAPSQAVAFHGFATLGDRPQWVGRPGAIQESRSERGLAWFDPGQHHTTDISESIVTWLKQDPDFASPARGKLAEVTVWCDLGEVILFVVDKRALEAFAQTQRTLMELGKFRWEPVLSGMANEQSLLHGDQETDQELESRVFENLWQENAETVVTAIEDGGRLGPVPVFGLGHETSENED